MAGRVDRDAISSGRVRSATVKRERWCSILWFNFFLSGTKKCWSSFYFLINVKKPGEKRENGIPLSRNEALNFRSFIISKRLYGFMSRHIPPELRALCNELDALGGGDARVEPVETICVLNRRGHGNHSDLVGTPVEATRPARAAVKHLADGKVVVSGKDVGSSRCYAVHRFVESSEQGKLADLVVLP